MNPGAAVETWYGKPPGRRCVFLATRGRQEDVGSTTVERRHRLALHEIDREYLAAAWDQYDFYLTSTHPEGKGLTKETRDALSQRVWDDGMGVLKQEVGHLFVS